MSDPSRGPVTPPPASQEPPPALPGAPAEPQPPAALDWRSVAGALSGAPIGHRLLYLPTTPSTSDVARDLAAEGYPDGTVVVADAQTAGRGRAGKAPWLTPAGSCLAVSVLLRPPLPPGELAGIGMAAGVAAVTALGAVAGVAAGLKWPNDVVAIPAVASKRGSAAGGATGGKLGGILVESALRGERVAHAVLGIGLNVNLRATELGPLAGASLPPTTVLDLTGRLVSREALLLRLLRELGRLLPALYRGQRDLVLRPYREAQVLLGRTVRLSGAGPPGNADAIEGVAEGITDGGALVLRLAGGRREVFPYGEVTLRPAQV